MHPIDAMVPHGCTGVQHREARQENGCAPDMSSRGTPGEAQPRNGRQQETGRKTKREHESSAWDMWCKRKKGMANARKARGEARDT